VLGHLVRPLRDQAPIFLEPQVMVAWIGDLHEIDECVSGPRA